MDFNSEQLLDESIPRSTPMRDYFRGKTIFLTGGTGFLGQLYVEKLLRIEVKKIYLLTRQKKGKSPAERLKEIYSGVVYSKLTAADPDYLKRIQIVEGDLEKLLLGISDGELEEICENVQIVLHAAADVRFDETLRKLLMVNLRGTKELLSISEKIKNLEVFCYISTAFSHCYQLALDEKFYEVPVDPEVMIRVAEKYESDKSETFERIQNAIISPWPNTYTYTKSLCEEMVRRYSHKFPICVLRPTIIIATHEDPIPAWCNNIYGLNGVLVACGLGVLRLMPLDRRIVGDIVCADFVINSTLASIWATHEQFPTGKVEPGTTPEIYHVSSYQDRPVKWGEINDRMKELFAEYPAKRMLWKHCPNSSVCPFMQKLLTIYYHVIPAFFLDFYLKLTSKNVKLLPVYRKVQKFMHSLKYFMTREFRFTNNNMKRVLAKMSKEDSEYFPSDVRRYNWRDYSYNYTHGLRTYIGGETMDKLPAAKSRYKKLVAAHYLVLAIYYGIHIFLFYLIFRHFGIIDTLWSYINGTYTFIENSLK